MHVDIADIEREKFEDNSTGVVIDEQLEKSFYELNNYRRTKYFHSLFKTPDKLCNIHEAFQHPVGSLAQGDRESG